MSQSRLLLVQAALLAGLVSAGAHAARPAESAALSSAPDFKSAIPLGSARATVVLKLAGDPVAVVRSQAPGKKISDSQRRAIEQSLRAQQDGLRSMIEANGGRVIAQFQNAINGIKVQVPANRLADMALLPGVVDVKPVAVYKMDNIRGVPFIGAPAVWQGPPGFHGEGVKVAVIDTGIDFTHANFGGPGTVAAFDAAFAHNTQPADPALFGPDAPKVKGGTDLVGDNYDASASPLADGSPNPKTIPQPDPNPLDCNGHGSHVAGTAVGFGVKADGTTFQGSYDANTDGSAAFASSSAIGPGVAPLADLYSVRVFGCSGSTDVVVEALDWAVQHDMDVVNMSLGSPFGTGNTADAEASNNAVDAGIIVVASAGNSGTNPYITGSPASGDKAISVAAVDSTATFPGVNLALSTGTNVTAIDANGIAPANNSSLQIVVLRNPNGTISLGCNKAEYTAAGVTGKLVVTVRGTCARVARAVFGQQAGAAAVLVINNAAGLPPFEGPITGNPDTGERFNVTIPFLGVSSTAAAEVTAAAASPATLTNKTIANPTFRAFASFTSGGPRFGDGNLKPDLSAPGVSIFSTAVGTGNGGEFLSGTSMAAPHTTGAAALVVQSHPGWDAGDIRAAIVNTADASKLTGFSVRVGGGGLVQPQPATQTSVVATTHVPGRDGKDTDAETNLSFGVDEFTQDLQQSGDISVRNLGTRTATFNVSSTSMVATPHSVSINQPTITLKGGQSRTVHVDLQVPAATAGDSSAFRNVAGFISLTPASPSDNAGVALRVPYFAVTRARSQVEGLLATDSTGAASVQVQNNSTQVAGSADFYAWGLSGKNKKAGSVGLRAVGVQSFPFSSSRLLVFAINTFAPTSNASVNEYDIVVDSNGDGTPDFLVFGADLGAVQTGSFSGRMASGVVNLATGAVRLEFLATAPTDGTTIELAVVASDIGVTAANPRFSYQAQAIDGFTGNADVLAGTAKFNAFSSAISQGDFEDLAPGARASVPVTVNATEFAQTPALGQMVVSIDNSSGKKQAILLKLDGSSDDT